MLSVYKKNNLGWKTPLLPERTLSMIPPWKWLHIKKKKNFFVSIVYLGANFPFYSILFTSEDEHSLQVVAFFFTSTLFSFCSNMQSYIVNKSEQFLPIYLLFYFCKLFFYLLDFLFTYCFFWKNHPTQAKFHNFSVQMKRLCIPFIIWIKFADILQWPKLWLKRIFIFFSLQ